MLVLLIVVTPIIVLLVWAAACDRRERGRNNPGTDVGRRAVAGKTRVETNSKTVNHAATDTDPVRAWRRAFTDACRTDASRGPFARIMDTRPAPRQSPAWTVRRTGTGATTSRPDRRPPGR